MPVVTMTTFQVGVSGVASRSRFTTPTRSGAWRMVSAIGRTASVLPVPAAARSAQKLQETPQNLTPDQMEARLHYRTGHVKLRGGLATLELPPEFRYLDARETGLVIRAWGNPPDSETLGMIVPAGLG